MDWVAVGTAMGGILVGAGGVVSWVVRSRKAPATGDTQVMRSNGHPCALHSGLVESITEIRSSAEEHHTQQQQGIDRIHARIDDLYRDLVRDRR